LRVVDDHAGLPTPSFLVTTLSGTNHDRAALSEFVGVLC
jgi:hypothetical protein